MRVAFVPLEAGPENKLEKSLDGEGFSFQHRQTEGHKFCRLIIYKYFILGVSTTNITLHVKLFMRVLQIYLYLFHVSI